MRRLTKAWGAFCDMQLHVYRTPRHRRWKLRCPPRIGSRHVRKTPRASRETPPMTRLSASAAASSYTSRHGHDR